MASTILYIRLLGHRLKVRLFEWPAPATPLPCWPAQYVSSLSQLCPHIAHQLGPQAVACITMEDRPTTKHLGRWCTRRRLGDLWRGSWGLAARTEEGRRPSFDRPASGSHRPGGSRHYYCLVITHFTLHTTYNFFLEVLRSVLPCTIRSSYYTLHMRSNPITKICDL